MGARASKGRTAVTSMRLSADVMQKAGAKAKKLGLSRTQYVEQILRKDLGLDNVLAAERTAESSTVFA